MTEIIHAKALCKHYDRGRTVALDGIDVRVDAGEFVAIIGLSGAGKTTLLRLVNATLAPTAGELRVLGQDVGRLDERGVRDLRRQIGFIFQQFNLVKNLSALQNVLVGRVAYAPLWRTLTGWYAREDVELARLALDAVGLRGRYDDEARALSGGQQQRIAIARALVQQPRILLADEPMASLDPRLSQTVLDILADVNRRQGITVLINIHVLELAKRYARRLVALRKGKVVFDGPPDRLDAATIERIYHVETEAG
jgi:phosphonate transport system ATP-binding protein